MSQPTHNMDDFLKACAEGTQKVFVHKGAMETAKSDFNLMTQERVLQFVGDDGLEKPSFINSKPWENNPDPATPIQVDAWGFFSGLLHGYIAFFFQPKTKKWNIKSLKKNTDSDPRNLALKDGLKKLLEKQEGNKS